MFMALLCTYLFVRGLRKENELRRIEEQKKELRKKLADAEKAKKSSKKPPNMPESKGRSPLRPAPGKYDYDSIKRAMEKYMKAMRQDMARMTKDMNKEFLEMQADMSKDINQMFKEVFGDFKPKKKAKPPAARLQVAEQASQDTVALYVTKLGLLLGLETPYASGFKLDLKHSGNGQILRLVIDDMVYRDSEPCILFQPLTINHPNGQVVKILHVPIRELAWTQAKVTPPNPKRDKVMDDMQQILQEIVRNNGP